MQKRTSKLISTLLALCMVLSLLPGTALAADTDFVIEDGLLTKYTGSGGAVTIPDTVTSIKYRVFAGSKITSLTIPSSVTIIDKAAFVSTTLTDITVESGNPAFCSVDGVLFSADMTLLHTYPAGKSDKSYTIPASVTSIRGEAFYLCQKLTSLTIPGGVTTFGEKVFTGCDSLTDIYYGGSSSQWNAISYLKDSDVPDAATVHFSFGNDAPSRWAADQVDAAVSHNIVPDSLLGQFTRPITRAEFCALATKLYETVKGGAVSGRAAFTDTEDVNVQKMASLGVVTGMGDGTFAPNASLTRQQAAVMLSQLAKVLDRSLAETAATFSDNGQIASWALTAVGQVQAAGIMSGTGNNNFSPAGQYTREQSIITMLKIYDLATHAVYRSDGDYTYEALRYIYTHLKFPSTMDVVTIRRGRYDRRENFKDAPDFVKPTHSLLSWNNDYYVVSMTIKAANSFGALTTETYVSLYDVTTGKTYHDLVNYADSRANDAYGATKLDYMDLKSEALLLAASIKFDTVPQEEVNRIANSVKF